jgi:hypothetical protein
MAEMSGRGMVGGCILVLLERFVRERGKGRGGTNALFVGDSTEGEIPDDSGLLVESYGTGGVGIPSSVGREAVVVQGYFLAVIHFAYSVLF